jgi:glycosyltransferase involved in cell wall biosynthesis
MRALQVLGPSTGGIRVHVAALAEGLREAGVDAPVVGPRGVMDGLGLQDGIVAVPAGTSPSGLLRARAGLRPWRRNADVVHAHGLKAGWVAVEARRRTPVVLTLHNVVLDEAAGRTARAQRALERAVIGRADRVIAPTTAIADGVAGIVAPSRIRVVVPASPVPVPRRARRTVRAELGANDDTPLVVCVARLHPQKDLRTLLGAWRAVARDVPAARLAIVGEGPDRAELSAAATAAGIDRSVTFAGFSDHAVDQLAAADLVAISSIWEAIPLVLAESLQLGVPVVSTDVGLARELLGDGRAGQVVAVGDEDALGGAIVGLLADPPALVAAAEAARTVAQSRFDPETLVRQVLDVYLEVA